MLIHWIRLLILPLVLLLAACAIESSKPETVVAKRAQARWDALIKGDLETAYQFLSPGYRQAMPFDRYERNIHGVGLWQAARVSKVVCKQPDVCEATVEVDVKLVVPRIQEPIESTNPLYERWVYTDKQWWYVPE